MTNTPPKVSLHIGGEARSSGSGGTHAHLNPVTGFVQASIPPAGAKEIEEAVAKAEAAREGWRRTPPEARRHLMNRLANLIDANAEEFAKAAALDGGTPLMMGARGAGLASMWTRYYAGWCDKLSGEMISTFDTRGGVSLHFARTHWHCGNHHHLERPGHFARHEGWPCVGSGQLRDRQTGGNYALRA